MSRRRFNWDLLIKLAEKYEENANQCLESGAYIAGLVCVRAALETMLFARFLLELFDWTPEECEENKITVNGAIIEVPNVHLAELIKGAEEQKLLRKSGFLAAERIRIWGNKIHCSNVANNHRLPNIGKKNLRARLKDLKIVYHQLMRSL